MITIEYFFTPFVKMINFVWSSSSFCWVCFHTSLLRVNQTARKHNNRLHYNQKEKQNFWINIPNISRFKDFFSFSFFLDAAALTSLFPRNSPAFLAARQTENHICKGFDPITAWVCFPHKGCIQGSHNYLYVRFGWQLSMTSC